MSLNESLAKLHQKYKVDETEEQVAESVADIEPAELVRIANETPGVEEFLKLYLKNPDGNQKAMLTVASKKSGDSIKEIKDALSELGFEVEL